MKTKENNIIQKAILFFLILISILLIILVMEKSGIIESKQNINKKLLNSGEMVISEGVMSKTVDSSNWDTNKVTVVTDGDGNVVPVPKGYVASEVTGENTVRKGLVIYEGDTPVNDQSDVWQEQISRNQWVWVPVPYPDRIYEEINGVKKSKLYSFGPSGRAEYENRGLEPAIAFGSDTESNFSANGLTGMTPDKFYQELQLEFNETIESIKKYGGFYMGRYETGNLSENKPVVQKMNTDISAYNWYILYSKMGYLAANEKVKTNMIWGNLWDETLQYFIEESYEASDYAEYTGYPYVSTSASKEWGNYINSTFSYVNESWQTVRKESGVQVCIPAGSSEQLKRLNIYDLAGNAWEWTLEVLGTSNRIVRGGGFYAESYDYTASARDKDNLFNATNRGMGCRAYLYIK